MLVGLTLASGAASALLFYGSVRLGWAFSDRGGGNTPGILVFLLPLVVLVGWPLTAILLMTLFKRTAVGAAMLIGFGLALLVGVGTCFVLIFGGGNDYPADPPPPPATTQAR